MLKRPPLSPPFAIAAGAIVVAILAMSGSAAGGNALTRQLSGKAERAIAAAGGAPVKADFYAVRGWPSRHPLLSGGEGLDEGLRAKVARAVADVPGVGGIRWADGTIRAQVGDTPITPLHCQDDVEALLTARSIRFEESSAAIAPSSMSLIDEVSAALAPCHGSIIAITGHTDDSGDDRANLTLSLDRARAVREALVERGVTRSSLRARGVGSREPIGGLDAGDPANRRIEFSVVMTVPIKPTPVDTPGAR